MGGAEVVGDLRRRHCADEPDGVGDPEPFRGRAHLVRQRPGTHPREPDVVPSAPQPGEGLQGEQRVLALVEQADRDETQRRPWRKGGQVRRG